MITLEEAAQATGGHLSARALPLDTPLQGGAFDSRELAGADIFFALTIGGGNGHQYLHTLRNSTVKLAVVSQPGQPAGFKGAVLLVPDTLAALAQLAAKVVQNHRPRIVAITGSYGKTTAKEVIAHVLGGKVTVLRNPGSFNNEIGVPITLLGLDGSQEVAVLEFSARKPGDIAYLARIAPPDIAVLLNVGTAHIGIFGSREAIIRTKTEFFSDPKPVPLAIVNGEDPRLLREAEAAGVGGILTFGLDAGDFSAQDLSTDGEGRAAFTAVHKEARLPMRAGFPGPHGPYPLLACWAVARALNLPDALVAERIGHAPVQKGRVNLLRTPAGAVLIDDSYNASADPVVNLIRLLAQRAETRKVLLLGPLGEAENGLEDSAAVIAPHLGAALSQCLVYDPVSDLLFRLLRNLAPDAPLSFHNDQERLLATLADWNRPGTVIAVKGARSAHTERFVAGLMGATVQCRLPVCGLLLSCTQCPRLTGNFQQNKP